MASTAAVLALLLLFVPSLHAAVSGKACSCYLTSTHDLFNTYRVHDFRRLPVPASIPALPSQLPPTVTDSTSHSSIPIGTRQQGFLTSKEWASSWDIQTWGKGVSNETKYKMWNSLSSVYIDYENTTTTTTTGKVRTRLVLKTRRFEGFQISAEVENLQKNLLHASTRIRARVLGDSGAVAGLFYYRNDNNESDIEILTRDEASAIWYSNQPVLDSAGNQIPNASTRADLITNNLTDGTQLTSKRSPEFSWSDWHTHRIDWTAGKSSWFVDGNHVLDKTYGVPTATAYLVLNMWSDGGVWSGVMDVGKEARLEIEWIEMAFNTSDEEGMGKREREPGQGGDGCRKLCVVDDSAPSLSAAGRIGGGLREGIMAAVVVVLLAQWL
ncbi:concanavalin A-like lectin/glucanase domain-containing protein [Sphaerosporella brunnea]|uniref:Concanavalin A-like lectin/glucanase domain-containing protein n=1 Tax=Sphaerosporella brunnea TaxID=1250544 RepID=A0A5J5FBJ7_9PEZI|nr:concanavalin A-like lectin/glucanase domain-containing protein [Sphaerosporella brunnea]